MSDRFVLLGSAQRFVGGRGEVAGAGVAVGGILGHAAGDDAVEGGGNARAELAGARDGLTQVRGHQGGEAVGTVRGAAGQTLVQHTRQRVDVGAVGHLFVIAESFRGHVVPRAHRHPGLGQMLVGDRCGDAEIDEVGEIVAGEQDVLGFDVAVHHPGGVGGIQGRGDLTHDGHRPGRRQGAATLQQRADIGALDHPHVDEQLAVDFAVVVDGHHVGFLQPPGGVGLALHPLAKHGILGYLCRHQLERHHPVLDRVVGLVDLAHPAAAQQPAQLIVPEPQAHARTLPGLTHR